MQFAIIAFSCILAHVDCLERRRNRVPLALRLQLTGCRWAAIWAGICVCGWNAFQPHKQARNQRVRVSVCTKRPYNACDISQSTQHGCVARCVTIEVV